MKRRKLFLLLSLLCPAVSLFAQDTLQIGMGPHFPVVQTGHNVFNTGSFNTLNLAGSFWIIKIKTKPGNSIEISDGKEAHVLTITDTSKIIEVRNMHMQLPGVSWSFSSEIDVKIKTSAWEKDYTIELIDPSALNYQPGSMLYDAAYLHKKGSDPRIKLQILAYYAGVVVNPDSVANAYKQDTLLYSFVVRQIAQYNSIGSQQSGGALAGLIPALSSLGGLDVTAIADGFARFIVKRAKEELDLAFFSSFKDALNDTVKHKELRDLHVLFPQTTKTLNVIGDQIYNYNVYLQALREGFEKDLSALPDNLPHIIVNHDDFFHKYPALAASLRGSCYVANALQEKEHPGDIIRNFPANVLDSVNVAVKGSVQLVQLLSESLRDTAQDETHYWVSLDVVKSTLKDTAVLHIYLGLLDEVAMREYNNVQFSPNVSLAGMLNVPGFLKNANAYRTYVITMAQKTQNIDQLVESYKRPANDSVAFEMYYKYFTASVDLLQYGVGFGKLPGVNLPALGDSTQKYFDAAKLVADLTLDVSRRNYSSGIVDLVGLYDVLLKEKEVSGSNEKMIKAQNQKITDLQNNLLKYGTFMASIAQAKTSEQVADAIDAFALPVGSARIKRESRCNVALNAYCGLFTGYERIPGVDPCFLTRPGGRKLNTFGVTAPIGIAFSWGGAGRAFSKARYHSSYSIFFSVVDLGALAAFRFTNDSVAQAPTVLLKDIISPGVFFSWGFPRIPVSLNLGLQAGPNLRKVDTSAGSPANVYAGDVYYRFSAGLCVDIPVLNFYTKERVR